MDRTEQWLVGWGQSGVLHGRGDGSIVPYVSGDEVSGCSVG